MHQNPELRQVRALHFLELAQHGFGERVQDGRQTGVLQHHFLQQGEELRCQLVRPRQQLSERVFFQQLDLACHLDSLMQLLQLGVESFDVLGDMASGLGGLGHRASFRGRDVVEGLDVVFEEHLGLDLVL